MTPDEQHELYTQAFQAGQAHAKSAPETLERFNNIDKTMLLMDSKMDKILDFMERTESHLSTLNGKVAKHNEWLNKNDNAVTKDLPDLKKQVSDNSKKIYAGVVLLGVVQFLISKLA